jgi:hypothetical protein
MGVRVPDQARRKLLEELIEREQRGVLSILEDYKVPLVDDQGNLVTGQSKK